ncbi:unnamed protein product [Trichobilharzia regenti]|nr:unnamed protein product [Trichobilharzia regenti]
MNPRQKAPRSGQKSPSFLVEEDQQSYVIDYDQEVEQKSSRSTYEIKSYKPFTGNNPKSFPSGILLDLKSKILLEHTYKNVYTEKYIFVVDKMFRQNILLK